MNRHGYKVRKFGRETDQRRALIRGLASELIQNEAIETTLPKARATLKYTEKLITKAKKANSNLAARRQLIAMLDTPSNANKLIDHISPKLESRSSGHLRIKRTTLRRGDGTQLAKLSFVDDLSDSKIKPKSNDKAKKKKTDDNDPIVKTKTTIKATRTIESHASGEGQTSRRTGRRGNR